MKCSKCERELDEEEVSTFVAVIVIAVIISVIVVLGFAIYSFFLMEWCDYKYPGIDVLSEYYECSDTNIFRILL